jgi:hypothetical protein
MRLDVPFKSHPCGLGSILCRLYGNPQPVIVTIGQASGMAGERCHRFGEQPGRNGVLLSEPPPCLAAA